ncbi:Uncharacterised protein [Mycobacteroides abscessus subsp. abscessus]|uniref:DUF7213 family protein n=1 Tax=Mycobacteroides abscessus TaxID=36809 RepID=UPI0009264A5D|nr:hypothetical protein [Mycobacteroides abscessus]QSM04301.1 hypothetical protein PROPHIGD27-1_112 [Mycobacterium phage prophiGD27-1]SKY31938.1 Uncharacterised protein [Mycobacteroides abscessus subsp. massiliense]MBN7406899.1 hypothetical protein [Mycobacteroides abscessus subsp. abscessus]QSM90555.1 hypothetical protein I3U44_07775 [Mycobacteroides abscessus subsp. bolletii]SHU23195.1 Uncharacterised protein [Mycobacteroides abscessus subsp. abscessus]
MSDNPDDLIQQYADLRDDSPGDWRVAAYVLIVGYERVVDDEVIEHTNAVFERGNQPPWATKGLLAHGAEHLERTE